MPIAPQRWAMAAIMVLLLLSALPSLGSAAPASQYSIYVVVTTSSGAPAPNGVNVTLMVGATGQSCQLQTSGGGGTVSFLNGAPDMFNRICTIAPGWYTVSVPPQVDVSSGAPSHIGIFPSGSSSTFSATQSQLSAGYLVRIGGVTTSLMSKSLTGMIDLNGAQEYNASAVVQVLDPAYPGLVLASGAFTGKYTFASDLPAGTWTVYSTMNLGQNTLTNYTQVTVPTVNNRWDVNLSSYLVSGLIFPTENLRFTNQTNITLYDLSSGATYHFVNPPSAYPQTSNYYQFGSYNSLAGSSTASSTFLALFAPQGESPVWRYFYASPSNPTQNFDLSTSSLRSTVQNTTLTFNSTFDGVNVYSSTQLGNGSVVRALANAGVGDLYAQVGMDFNSGALNASSAAWTAFENWLQLSGPVYPADQANLQVNKTSYTETANYGFYPGATPTDLEFSSAQAFSYNTTESYAIANNLNDRTSSHNLTFGFRYPTSTEQLSYRVNLPSGWVLSADSPVPAGTSLAAAGPGGTWSSFFLNVSRSPYGAQNGTVSFQLTKVQKVTVAVNVVSPNFVFANKTNILNDTHSNYTVLVGVNQNASFSAATSVFPAGFNATSYYWSFGDGNSQYTYRHNTSVYHTYTSGGRFDAYVILTANGGQTSRQNVTVYVDDAKPTPKITVNDTRGLLTGLGAAGNESLLRINWSQSLRLNATGSKDAIHNPQPPYLPSGNIGDAIWNISAGTTYTSTNYSVAGQAASVFANVTYQFTGAGPWISSQSIDGASYTVNGWVYKVVLREFDAGGNNASSTLWVLVNDTEKPNPVADVQGGGYFSPANLEGKNTTSGTALPSGYCPITLVDKWSNDPHNGSVVAWNWEISNPGWSGFSKIWKNATNDNSTNLQLKVPQTSSAATSSAYFVNLTVKDRAGNLANTSVLFTCQLNSTTAPILQSLTLKGPSSVTEGQKYSFSVNVTNVGGSLSVANATHVRFYFETSSGGSPTNISWGTLYGYTGGQVNSSAEPGVTQANLHYNVTYQAQVTWAVSGGGVTGGLAPGQYRICANATSYSEASGSYSTQANVACTTITVNQSTLQQYFVGIVIAVVVIVVLVLVFFLYNRRSKGGSVKKASSGSKGSKKPAADEEDEDEEEEEDEEPRPKGKSSSKDEDDD